MNATILLFVVTNYLAGYAAYRLFFRKTSIFEAILMPQVLSLIVSPALFLILYIIFGFDASVFLLPFVILLITILSFRVKQEKAKSGLQKKIILFLLLLVLIIAVNFVNMAPFSRFADISFHLSIANEITNHKTLPPDTTCFTGEPFHYPWFYPLMLSFMSIYSGFSAFSIVPFFGVYLGILFIFSSFYLGKFLFGDDFLAFVFASAILTSYFIGAFYVTVPQAYVMPLVIMFFYSLFSFERNPSLLNAAFTGTIGASTIYVHGLSFVFVMLAIFSYILYKLIEFDAKKIKYLPAICIMLLLAVPYYLFISKQTSSMFLFEPFYGLLFNYVGTYNILLIFLPLAFKKVLKEKNHEISLSFAMLIMLFVFVNVFAMPKSPNIERFFIFMIFPLLFISIHYLRDLKKIKKIAAGAIILLVFFAPAVADLSESFRAKPFMSSEEYVVSVWMKQNLGLNDTFLAAPLAVYTGISERNPVICKDDFLRAWFYDGDKIKSRFSDEIIMFAHPSRDLYGNYNTKYIILGDNERKFLSDYDMLPYDFSNSSAFKKAFSYKNSTVYELIDARALPENSDNIQLNFTKYSRWWEV